MTEKTIMKWLERLLAAEVELALKARDFPLQLPKKQAKELIDMGYVEEVFTKENTTIGAMHCVFHVLSHKGRYKYCESCKDTEEES